MPGSRPRASDTEREGGVVAVSSPKWYSSSMNRRVPYCRLRCFLRWAGITVCIISVLALLLSLLLNATMYRTGWGVALGSGCVTVQSTSAQYGNPQQGWSFSERQAAQPLMRCWWVRILRPRPGLWAVIVPLWIPPLILGISTFFLWRRRLRRPPGHCQSCGYNLMGNVSGVCPECGKQIESS
jgi:hypothetical protein